jgi:hypothetical protein
MIQKLAFFSIQNDAFSQSSLRHGFTRMNTDFKLRAFIKLEVGGLEASLISLDGPFKSIATDQELQYRRII